MERAEMDYRQMIIDMLEGVNDLRFLRQVYTIVIKYIRRAGN